MLRAIAVSAAWILHSTGVLAVEATFLGDGAFVMKGECENLATDPDQKRHLHKLTKTYVGDDAGFVRCTYTDIRETAPNTWDIKLQCNESGSEFVENETWTKMSDGSIYRKGGEQEFFFDCPVAK